MKLDLMTNNISLIEQAADFVAINLEKSFLQIQIQIQIRQSKNHKNQRTLQLTKFLNSSEIKYN
jgi:hypothetical protein